MLPFASCYSFPPWGWGTRHSPPCFRVAERSAAINARLVEVGPGGGRRHSTAPCETAGNVTPRRGETGKNEQRPTPGQLNRDGGSPRREGKDRRVRTDSMGRGTELPCAGGTGSAGSSTASPARLPRAPLGLPLQEGRAPEDQLQAPHCARQQHLTSQQAPRSSSGLPQSRLQNQSAALG